MAAFSPFPFGLVVPGRELVTSFMPVAENRCMVSLPQPQTISELSFFMTAPLPSGFGAILHFSFDPFSNWEILGAIGPSKPSGVFRTGFALRDGMTTQATVQIGISIEPLDVLENLDIASVGVEDRVVANKVAMNLFNYMSSFADTSKPGFMMVPNTAFDEWITRFERKSKIDPNFFMKQ